MEEYKMVKKFTHVTEFWTCEVCGDLHDSKEEAEKCEKKNPEKIAIHGTEGSGKVTWEIGDLVLVSIHDDCRRYRLAFIDSQEVKRHKIYPRFHFLDRDPRQYDDWNDTAIKLDDSMKKKIIEWAEKIKSFKIEVE